MTPTPIHTDLAPKAIGPYSQAIRTDHLLFTAGQIPLDPLTMTLVEGEIVAQAHRVLQNLQAVLAAAGTDFAHVVKTTVFLTDMANFPALNQVYAHYFGDAKPARSTVAVAALPLGALVEIECVATVP